MKRTKQLQEVIDCTNRYLRLNKIKDEADPAFHVLTWSLLQIGCYYGFNYFKDAQIGNEILPVLAGSSTKFDYLQIY